MLVSSSSDFDVSSSCSLRYTDCSLSALVSSCSVSVWLLLRLLSPNEIEELKDESQRIEFNDVLVERLGCTIGGYVSSSSFSRIWFGK